MSEQAVRKLGLVRDRHCPDVEARQDAAAKAVNGLVDAAKKAGLVVETNNIVHKFRLHRTAAATLRLSAEGGSVLIGENLKPISDEWAYDPLTKDFRGPNGEDGVDLLAAVVGGTLDELEQKAAKRPR